MKKVLAVVLASVMIVASLAACGSSGGGNKAAAQGKVFNIYAWNEEFKGFFEKYYTVPEGIEVKWTIVPSDNGQYQDALDQALSNAVCRCSMFLRSLPRAWECLTEHQ